MFLIYVFPFPPVLVLLVLAFGIYHLVVRHKRRKRYELGAKWVKDQLPKQEPKKELENPLLTIAEAATFLKLSEQALLHMFDDGRLPFSDLTEKGPVFHQLQLQRYKMAHSMEFRIYDMRYPKTAN